MDLTQLDAMAATIRDFLVSVLLIGGPLALVAGFVMMAFSGFNPSWRQRGIDTVKWTIIGAIGVGVLALALWGFVETGAGLQLGGLGGG